MSASASPDAAAEQASLAELRVAILGLGLMGGSLALALHGQTGALWGADPDPAVRALALERQVVERVEADPARLIGEADVIILAAPVRAILAQLAQFSQAAPGGGEAQTIVLDLGSTKAAIVAAMAGLPASFDPLGGHPMCGKETSGLVSADPLIYRGAPFAFTPLARTSLRGRAVAENLASTVGAVPLWIDAPTHDRWVASTSHLPYLLAAALAGVTPAEAAPLIGPGYRSTSRLSTASLTVMLDILRTNQQPVLEALRRFHRQVEQVEALLENDNFSALADLLAASAQRQHSLLRQEPPSA